MLDFYKISDNEDNPEYPDENLYIGSINWEEHEYINGFFAPIKKKKLLHYYNDLRFKSTDIKKLNSYVTNSIIKLMDDDAQRVSVEKFYQILEAAKKENMGIMVFCD